MNIEYMMNNPKTVVRMTVMNNIWIIHTEYEYPKSVTKYPQSGGGCPVLGSCLLILCDCRRGTNRLGWGAKGIRGESGQRRRNSNSSKLSTLSHRVMPHCVSLTITEGLMTISNRYIVIDFSIQVEGWVLLVDLVLELRDCQTMSILTTLYSEFLRTRTGCLCCCDLFLPDNHYGCGVCRWCHHWCRFPHNYWVCSTNFLVNRRILMVYWILILFSCL